MRSKILITGSPRSGKSTLISRIIEFYSKENYVIYGFLTPEVRMGGKRVGFDVEDIYSGKRNKFARAGNYKTQFKLGRYSIFIKEFDQMISKLEKVEIQKIDLLIIDEIGKMELFSKKFQEFIKKQFQLDISIVATIGQKIQHPVKNFILKISKVNLFNLNRQNQQKVFQEIISLDN